MAQMLLMLIQCFKTLSQSHTFNVKVKVKFDEVFLSGLYFYMPYGTASYLAYSAPHDKGVCHDPNPRSDFDVKVKVDFNDICLSEMYFLPASKDQLHT